VPLGPSKEAKHVVAPVKQDAVFEPAGMLPAEKVEGGFLYPGDD
jgi:hypothetical protein